MRDPADWVVLILVGGVLSFFACVVIKSRQGERKDQQDRHDR